MPDVDKFKEALLGKKIPILILDNKWHKLFAKTGTTDEIKALEEKLQSLLKQQGKITNENQELKKIKSNLMSEIVSNMDGVDADSNSQNKKVLNNNKSLIGDANKRLAENEDLLLELPREIDKVNKELMLHTMDLCYSKLKENTEIIEQIAEWISGMRIALKKNIIKKQEKEINNAELYSYMHDIFGPDVMELFDMKYEPTLPSSGATSGSSPNSSNSDSNSALKPEP